MERKKEEFVKVRQNNRGQKILYLPVDTEFNKGDWVMCVDPLYKVDSLPTKEEKNE